MSEQTCMALAKRPWLESKYSFVLERGNKAASPPTYMLPNGRAARRRRPTPTACAPAPTTPLTVAGDVRPAVPVVRGACFGQVQWRWPGSGVRLARLVLDCTDASSTSKQWSSSTSGAFWFLCVCVGCRVARGWEDHGRGAGHWAGAEITHWFALLSVKE